MASKDQVLRVKPKAPQWYKKLWSKLRSWKTGSPLQSNQSKEEHQEPSSNVAANRNSEMTNVQTVENLLYPYWHSVYSSLDGQWISSNQQMLSSNREANPANNKQPGSYDVAGVLSQQDTMVDDRDVPDVDFQTPSEYYAEKTEVDIYGMPDSTEQYHSSVTYDSMNTGDLSFNSDWTDSVVSY